MGWSTPEEKAAEVAQLREQLLSFPGLAAQAARDEAKEKLNKLADGQLKSLESAKTDTNAERLELWNRCYKFLTEWPEDVGCLPWRIATLMRREAVKLRGECLRNIPDPGTHYRYLETSRGDALDRLNWFIEWCEGRAAPVVTGPKKRGRRTVSVLSEADRKRVCEAWATGKYKAKKDLADALGFPPKDVVRAINANAKKKGRTASDK